MIRSKKVYDLQHHNGKNKQAKTEKLSVYKGLFLALLSGVFYSTASVIVKQMGNLHPAQLAVYRFIAISAFAFPQAVHCGENLLGPKEYRFMLAIRSIFGATNIFLHFVAFRYLPLGEASVILFSVPVFITVAARVFLKEPCGIFQSLTVLTTVIGIVFTTKLPQKLAGSPVIYTKESIYGLLSALASLFFNTYKYIVIRKVKDVHHSIIMLNYGWVAVIETIILTAIFGDFHLHKCGLQGLFIIVFGFLSYSGQTLLTVALQCEYAGPVSTVRAAADIILAFSWQILLFHDIPDVYSSMGAIFVGISVIFIGLKKWISSLSEESSYRKKFIWMLK